MRIINFGQMVDLEHGTKLEHQIMVEMPSGQRFQIVTDEGTVQQLADVLVEDGDHKLAKQKTLEDILEKGVDPDAEGLNEEPYSGTQSDFGGDYDPGELARIDGIYTPDAVMGALVEEPVLEDKPVRGGLGQSRERKKPPLSHKPLLDSDGFYLPPPSRTVPKDEMGYPIVPRRVQPPTVPDDDGEGDGTQI